jgi:hypothetical protein
VISTQRAGCIYGTSEYVGTKPLATAWLAAAVHSFLLLSHVSLAAGVATPASRQFTLVDDCFGDFLVRVTCPCGASRHIEPEMLASIAGRSVTFAALATRSAESPTSSGALLGRVLGAIGRPERHWVNLVP